MTHAERLDAFERVRTDYEGLLISLLWKMSGNRELFAEAFQYALLSMWRNIEKLNGEGAAGYIYRIALTANSRAWRNRMGKDNKLSRTLQEIGERPENKSGKKELMEMLRAAISILPKKQGQAVVMRYFQQKEYEQIAGIMGCSPAGARSNVSKGLAALRRGIENG